MDAESDVYLGAWTNWSRGSAITGATLTMTRKNGNFVIAFTALFVPFVASRFWRIFAIIFHQCYSTSESRPAIHHQRQVVLRNSSSPESGLVSFMRLVWAWRREAQRPWLKIIPMIIFAFFSVGVFTVAGGFSSQISTSGHVLIKGDNCEAASSDYWGNLTLANIGLSYWATFTNSLQNYAQQCYSNQSSAMPECSRFVVSALPTAIMDYNASCPFNRGVCRRDNGNLKLDTGHMNSNDIFGLNAPQEETFTFRYVLKCAPLHTEGRKRNTTVNGRRFTTYDYGLAGPPDKRWNFTYVVPDLATQYAKSSGFTNSVNFLLSVRSYQGPMGMNETSSFIARPAVPEHYGDVDLFFLSGNGVTFMPRLEDDWYRATVNYGGYVLGKDHDDDQVQYFPEEAASPLGCIQQHQWCRDPSQGQCGDLTGQMEAYYSAAPWFGLDRKDLESDSPTSQTRLGSSLIWAYLTLFAGSDLDGIIDALGASSLTSVISLTEGTAYGLKKNQWQLDVTQWWSIVLAGFQAKLVNTAQGSVNSYLRPHMYKPENEFEWSLCRNQKIQSAQYANFSIMGLVLMYSLGALIIVISFVIEPILRLLQRRGRYSKYAYLEWMGDTAIQLQRVAQDQLGHGEWSHCDRRIPITRPEDLLAPFDVSDPKHPVLAGTIDKAPKDSAVGLPEQDSSSGQYSDKISIEHIDESPSGKMGDDVRRTLSDPHAQNEGSRVYGIGGGL